MNEAKRHAFCAFFFWNNVQNEKWPTTFLGIVQASFALFSKQPTNRLNKVLCHSIRKVICILLRSFSFRPVNKTTGTCAARQRWLWRWSKMQTTDFRLRLKRPMFGGKVWVFSISFLAKNWFCWENSLSAVAWSFRESFQYFCAQTVVSTFAEFQLFFQHTAPR